MDSRHGCFAVLEAGSGRSAWQGPGESPYLTVGLIGTEGLWSSGIKGDVPSDVWEQKALLSRRPHLEGRMLETEPQVQGVGKL